MVSKSPFAKFVVPIALLIAVLWAIGPFAYKIVLNNGIHPLVVMFIASAFLAVCTAILGICQWDLIKVNMKKISKKSLMIICVTALFTAFLANIAYYYVLQNNSSYVVSALIYSAPLFSLVLSYLFLREGISLLGVVGVILMTLGVTCIAFN